MGEVLEFEFTGEVKYMKMKSLRFKQISAAGTSFTDMGQTVGIVVLFGLDEEGRVFKYNNQTEEWEPLSLAVMP